MTIMQAIESGFRNYANFKGRATRSEYWYWSLFNAVTTVSLCVIDERLNPGETWGIFSTVTLVVLLALLLPSLAVYARRLHDVDRSGWWMFVSLTVVGIVPLIYWLCSRGTAGFNHFGSDPFASSTPKPRIRLAAA